jgi:prepilin-type N-terminal cleavage/methylation domain-containing protein
MQKARGFTLIELLVAIAILGLVAVLSWRGLDSMVRTQTQTRERSEQLLTLQSALGQWSADLDALLPLAHTVPIDWDGQVLRLTRRSPVDAGEGALGRGRICGCAGSLPRCARAGPGCRPGSRPPSGHATLAMPTGAAKWPSCR